MDLRILGPLEIFDDGQMIPVSGARQRALLCALLLRSGEVVSADRLLEEVWGDSRPASGPAALQMRITQLRRALAAGRPSSGTPVLVTRAGGYELRVADDQVDARRFERLLAQGRALAEEANPAAAATCLRAALELWRGPALADFAFWPFAQQEINRLEELRLVAREERLDAELALGRAEMVAPEIEALVAAHPLRERLRGQLMVAMYRCGRQTEALAAYRDLRRLLTQELGVEPGRALRELERQVLEQDPALELPRRPRRRDLANEPPSSSRKPLTVACTVLRLGTEGNQEIDPERRSRAFARCQSVAVTALEQHGAQIALLPDGLLAVFGLPVVREDDALRALRATLAVHARLRALATELRGEHDLRVETRSAVATGDVLVAAGPPIDVLAIGEPAATALALATAAEQGDVLVAATTEPLVRHAAVLAPAGDSSPARWRVRSLAADAGGHAVRRDSPLVGRRSELEVLGRLLDRAETTRRVQPSCVVGPAGVGKSRLVQEFAEAIGDRAVVVTGACSQYGEVGARGPLRQIVDQIARGSPLVAVMGDAEHADLVAQLVAAAVGMGDASVRGDVFWAVARFIEAQTVAAPLVVVLEDLHWGSASLLALVEFLAAWPRPARLVLLCLMRPELLPERPGPQDLPWSERVELRPLAAAESDAMLANLTVGSSLSRDARERIRDAAEGNPLFLEQLLAMLTDRPGPDPVRGLPPTIAALLAARLDRLGPAERAVLERAAVAGKAFHRDVVAALLAPTARPTVDRHLAALCARDLLTPSASHDVGATHAFRHGLVQSAVHDGTPIESRAALHEALARWLDRDGSGQDELVGHHLAEAYRSRVALGHRDSHTQELAKDAGGRLRKAGAQAHIRGDMPAAATLLDRARSMTEADDVAGLEILPDLGYALFEVGELQRAEEVLTGAVDRALRAGADGVRWRATVSKLHLQMYRRPASVRVDQLMRTAAAAEKYLSAAGDEVGLTRALMLRSDLDIIRGRSTPALAAMERGLECARRAHARREEAWCYGQLGFALIAGETPADVGLRRCERMLRETAGDPVAEANLLPFLAVHEAMRDDIVAARAHAAQGRSATKELGLRWQEGIHALLSGYVELIAGDPVMAEWHVRAAATSFAEVGDRWFACIAAGELPRTLVEQGRHDDARAAIAEAAGLDVPDAEWAIKRRSLPAVLMAHALPSAEAVLQAREAVRIAERTDLLTWQAGALLDLADVLWLCDDPRGAVDVGEEALRRYARKGHLAGERKARARLGHSAHAGPARLL